jgi:coenzyme F420-reducing hydrogenase delta subunit
MTRDAPYRPRIARLGCVHATGASAGGELIPLPCGGRIDLATLIWPFALGGDGVMLLACPPDECRHRCQEADCDASGAEAISRARGVLSRLGLSPKRIARRSVAPGDDLGELIREQEKALAPLGNWATIELPSPAPEAEPLAVDRALRLLAHVQTALGPVGQGPKIDGGDLLWPGCGDLRLELAGAGGSPGASAELWRRGGGAVRADRPRCCGLPLAKAHELDAFSKLAQANVALIESSGAERVITACAACAETMNVLYPELGLELSLPVLDQGTWALETLALDQAASPVALVVPQRKDTPLQTVVDRLTASPSVILLEEPWSGETPEGPALRRAVVALTRDAARAGATNLIWLRPHLASTARTVLDLGGWQTGPELPIMDLNNALLELTRSQGTEVHHGG